MSKFTEFGARKLHKLYKMAQKKRSHEEEASLESFHERCCCSSSSPSPLKPSCHVSRGSRGRRRILQGGPKPSDQSRPAPAETPLVPSYPPNLPHTPASPAPTGTTGRLITQPINAILAVMVGGNDSYGAPGQSAFVCIDLIK